MNEGIESAIERLQTLVDYSKETGTKTNYIQGKILRNFSAEEQEIIISRLEVGSLALYGTDGAK